MQYLREGMAEGKVVQTCEQPGGRGRFGNSWVGAPGNLYMSLVLKPGKGESPGHYAFILAAAAAKAFADNVSPHKLQLKWPNDVLLDGIKMAGILIEAQWSDRQQLLGLVAGVGLNVDAPPPERAGLNAAAANRLSVDGARDAYLAALGEAIDMYRADGFAPIRDNWLAHAWGLGAPITVRLADRIEQGIFTGLTADGALLLKTDNVPEKEIFSGEILMNHQPG